MKKLNKYGLSPGKIFKVSVNHQRVSRDTISGIVTSPDNIILGDAVFGFSDWQGYTVPGTSHSGPYYWFNTSPVVKKEKKSDSLIEITTESGSIYLIEYTNVLTGSLDEPSDEVLEKMAVQVEFQKKVIEATNKFRN